MEEMVSLASPLPLRGPVQGNLALRTHPAWAVGRGKRCLPEREMREGYLSSPFHLHLMLRSLTGNGEAVYHAGLGPTWSAAVRVWPWQHGKHAGACRAYVLVCPSS